MTYKWSAYHLYGNVGEKFSSNCTGIFLGTENGNGIELYLYKILVNLRLSTGNPNKWYRQFMSSQ